MRRVMTILFIFSFMSFILMSCGMQGYESSMPSPEPETGEVMKPAKSPEEPSKSDQKKGEMAEPEQKPEEEKKSEEKYMVEIVDFRFSPATLKIPAGTEVTWTNRDRTFHTVTSNDELFGSGKLAKGWTFSHIFETQGTYKYHCEPHPYMKGTVIVE